MSPVYASRRRAEEFQALVERGESADARHGDLLLLVDSLRDVEPVLPRADFSVALRERLMVAAATELAPGSPAARLAMPPRRTKRERRIAAAVGGLALVGASTGLAAAAQSALPGDALYPLKRAIENAHTGLSMGDEAKGATLLANAQDRLEELSLLTSRGDDEGAMTQALDDFSDQATQASRLLLADYAESGRASSIAELRDFTGTSLDSLADLAPQVDGDAHEALLHAATVVTQIDAAAEAACPSCGGLGINDLPAVLVAAGLAIPTPTTTLTLPGSTIGSGTSADGQQVTKNGKGGKKDGSLTVPGTGKGTDDGPLEQLGQAVSGGGDGSASTSNGGSGGGITLPGLPGSSPGSTSGPSAGTSSGDPLGDLGDTIGDGIFGLGDTLTP